MASSIAQMDILPRLLSLSEFSLARHNSHSSSELLTISASD